MKKDELERRTKAFAIGIIKFVGELPKNKTTDVIGYQLLKAGTSIGANYREANHAVSKADFINKIGIGEKEASECQYWLEICQEVQLGHCGQINALVAESGELVAIFSSIGRTAKKNNTANSKFAFRSPK